MLVQRWDWRRLPPVSGADGETDETLAAQLEEQLAEEAAKPPLHLTLPLIFSGLLIFF